MSCKHKMPPLPKAHQSAQGGWGSGGKKKKKKEDVSDQLEDASVKRASFYQEFHCSSKRSSKGTRRETDQVKSRAD